MPQESFPKTPRLFYAIRWCVIFWGYIDHVFTQIFPKQYELRGGCQQTGECCKLIALEMPTYVKTNGFWYRFFYRFGIWWNSKINGFTYAGTLNDHFLGFTCNRLSKNNTCMDYFNRPRVCREYPVVGYFGKPRLYKGCGYWLSLKPKKIKLLKD